MSSFRPYAHNIKNSPYLGHHTNTPSNAKKERDIAELVENRNIGTTHDNFIIQNNANKAIMLGWKTEYEAGSRGDGWRQVRQARFRWTD